MTAQDRLIATAKAEVGYFGKKSNSQLDDKTANSGGKYNKYARDLDTLGDWFNGRKNGYDWCDIFNDWCHYKTFGKELALTIVCQPLKSLGAGCKYSMNYYKQAGRFSKKPSKAAQIFFGDSSSTWHTGIVTGYDNKYVYTIEGNAGSPCAVRECKYLLTYKYILGYGMPRYELVPDETTNTKELSFLENQDLFNKMYETMMATKKDNDSSSWSEDARAWGTETGIVTGTGTLADGSTNFEWENIPTREQFITMLKRYHDNVIVKMINKMLEK